MLHKCGIRDQTPKYCVIDTSQYGHSMCFNDRFLNVSSSESVERKSENKPLQNLTNRGGIRDHSSGTRGSWSAVLFMESEIKLS